MNKPDRSFALEDLVKGLKGVREIFGDKKCRLQYLTANSKEVRTGSLFVALRGELVDGHRFIADAIKKGAAAVCCEHLPSDDLGATTWIRTDDTQSLFPELVRRYFQDPASRLKLIGITGTNGKTTTAYLLEHLMSVRGGVLLVGTVEYRVKQKSYPSTNTTPGVYEITELMDEARREGSSYGVFEVSSHALKQGRLRGIHFRSAVFTNLTQDHLDYHRTFEDYYTSKRKLFEEHHPENSIINIDDVYGAKLAQELNPDQTKILTYSAKREASSWASDIALSLAGVSFCWHHGNRSIGIESTLVCRHSVYNLLAALTAAAEEGISCDESQTLIREFPGVPGRMERVGRGLPFFTFVDYAHTPDAISNVLSSIRQLIPQDKGRILTVFGCGGDRDRSKRPLMAREAESYSDEIFITSDNPRTEDPETILDEISTGLRRLHHRIPDRKEAIESALQAARNGDAVLILGKGHEDYQIIGTTKHPFSDQTVVRDWAAHHA